MRKRIPLSGVAADLPDTDINLGCSVVSPGNTAHRGSMENQMYQ
jgi:hypothetical protein